MTMGANNRRRFRHGSCAQAICTSWNPQRIAAAKSTNADVKALAAMIDKDHTAAGEKLGAAVATAGPTSVVATAAPNVTVPTTLDERRQGLIDNLKAATPG